MPHTIIGRKPVIEALKARTPIDSILMLKGVHGAALQEITDSAKRSKIPIRIADREEFDELSGNATTQGVIAFVSKRRESSVEDILKKVAASDQPGFVLILDEIEDPQNLGALVRSAECAGVHGVIVPKHHSAPVNSAAVKASAGATEHIPIAEVTNVVSELESLKEQGYWIVGLDEEGDREYSEVDYSTAIVLVIGNEGKGIRRLVREHCDFVARIPVFWKIQSLNASVAGGLAMYEVVRHRRGKQTKGQS